jgi:hypothetical protein
VTESIHPNRHPGRRTPVLLLFSNPHPLSVRAGMFLSEPRSRSFWRRLFDSSALRAPASLNAAIDHWTEDSPQLLARHLFDGDYSSNLLLHLDCLEPLPTNQYADLNRLFPGPAGRKLRQNLLYTPGLRRLASLSRTSRCHHWLVFSVQAFRKLSGDPNAAKNAPRRICRALDQWLESGDTARFWDTLADTRATLDLGGQPAHLHLPLIARAKHWQAKNSQRYFTLMLDRIFEAIPDFQ